MKTPLVISLLALALAAGCGDNSSPPVQKTNTTAGSPLTAPVDYLGAAGKAQQSAVKTVDTASINQAIQLFQLDRGRYPKDLNELVQEKFLSQIPPTPFGTKLVYSPNSGEVKVVRQ